MPPSWPKKYFVSEVAYGRVVTPDPWRHVTFVNYQNGYGRAED